MQSISGTTGWNFKILNWKSIFYYKKFNLKYQLVAMRAKYWLVALIVLSLKFQSKDLEKKFIYNEQKNEFDKFSIANTVYRSIQKSVEQSRCRIGSIYQLVDQNKPYNRLLVWIDNCLNILIRRKKSCRLIFWHFRASKALKGRNRKSTNNTQILWK